MGFLQIFHMFLSDSLIPTAIELLNRPTVDMLNVVVCKHSSYWWPVDSQTYIYFYELLVYLGSSTSLAFNSVLVVDSVLGHLIAEYFLLIDVSIWAIDLFCIIYASIADSFLLLENIVTHATNFVVAKAISTALKFLLCICFLIFARGGIPRYRFDYLTRLGWIRFLSLVLLSFLIELLILSMI